jgi:hypothetical protein
MFRFGGMYGSRGLVHMASRGSEPSGVIRIVRINLPNNIDDLGKPKPQAWNARLGNKVDHFS